MDTSRVDTPIFEWEKCATCHRTNVMLRELSSIGSVVHILSGHFGCMIFVLSFQCHCFSENYALTKL